MDDDYESWRTYEPPWRGDEPPWWQVWLGAIAGVTAVLALGWFCLWIVEVVR